MFKLPKRLITDGKHFYKYEIIDYSIKDKQLLIKTRTPLENIPKSIRIDKTWYFIDKDCFQHDNTITCINTPLYVIQLI